jgi:hypothetical protein
MLVFSYSQVFVIKKKSIPLVSRLLFILVIVMTVTGVVFGFYTNTDIPHLAIISVAILELLMVITGIILIVRHNKA